MTDSIGNVQHPSFLPMPIHHMTGIRRGLAGALVLAVALALAELAQTASSISALATCVAVSTALLVCAAVLRQAGDAPDADRVALAAKSVALFAAALAVVGILLNDWTRSQATIALLALLSGTSLWVGRVATGPPKRRVETLNTGSALAVVASLTMWALDSAEIVSAVESAAAPLALGAIAPLVAVGFSWSKPGPAALSQATVAIVLIALAVAPEHQVKLGVAAMVTVAAVVLVRNGLGHISPDLTQLDQRPQPWIPLASLVATLAAAVAIEGPWRWLAVSSLAVIAAGTITSQGVEIVARERLLVRLTRLNQLTASQARLDSLTRLPNRAALDARLNEEVERAIRYLHPVSVLFIDIDHFKAINDLLGHEAGDRALREIGATIRATIRTPDFVARFGGEEFVVIAPGTWSIDAAVLAQRIQLAVAEMAFGARGEPVTVSIGIAGVPEHSANPEHVLRAADEALYRAKYAGRDRVEIATTPQDQDRRDNS